MVEKIALATARRFNITQLRKGDLVTFTGRVTDVASYAEKDKPNQQQIQVKILPNGKELGWCVPQENAFEPKEFKLQEGDRVKYYPSDNTEYEIALIDNKQVVLKTVGSGNLTIGTLSGLVRV